MPILQIKALPQKDESKITPALKKTCKAIAEFSGIVFVNEGAKLFKIFRF